MRNINNSDNRINVDSKNYSTIARFRQEDDATLVLNLFKDGTEFDVSNQTITLRALRADGQSVNQTDNITKNKNIVTINFRRNILDIIGRCSIQLNISDSSGQFTTSEFPIEIERNNLGSDALKGSDNVQALQQILIDFKAEKSSLIKNITDDYNSLKKIIIDQNQAANLQNQINQNKQQSSQNTSRIEQLEDLTPVWQEHSGLGNITINDSFDGVAKDLTIKGSTLQNLVENGNIKKAIMRGGATQAKYMYSVIPDISNKIYTLILVAENVAKEGVNVSISFDKGTGSQGNIKGIKNGINIATNIIRDIVATELMLYYTSEDIGKLCDVKDIILLEGDYTNKPIPSTHFDSITSSGEQEDNKIKLKSVGKNLFDKNKLVNGEFVTYKGVECYKYKDNPDFFKYIDTFKDNTQYTFTARIYRDEGKEDKGVNIYFVYTDGTFDTATNNAGEVIKRTSQKGKTVAYIRGSYNHSHIAYLDLSIFQIEENIIATNYEQFRSKLIEIPLPFAKGLKSTLDGAIFDEINGNTGEIIQRVSDEYTALAKPVIHKINDIQLNTFDERTHIMQENNISSDISFKVKVSLSSQAKRLTEENKALKEENRELREDTNVIVDSLISFFGPMLLPYDDNSEEEQKIILEKLYAIKNR